MRQSATTSTATANRPRNHGRSVYYRGRRLQRLKGGGVSGNFVDVETGDEYWVSGVKKNGQDRHWAGSGAVDVDLDAHEEYRRLTGS